MNITTLAQLRNASIEDIDATDIAYLTAALGKAALLETTKDGRSLILGLRSRTDLIQSINPSVFDRDLTDANDKSVMSLMPRAQRLALSWEQLSYSALVVSKVGDVTVRNYRPVLSQLIRFDELSDENRAKLTYRHFEFLHNGFLRTASHAWLTATTLDAQNVPQVNLKHLSQAQWAQLWNLDFSQITADNLKSWLPNVALSSWNVAMLQKETATTVTTGNVTRKVKVFEVLNATQIAGIWTSLASLNRSTEIPLLKAEQLTGLSDAAWTRGQFLGSLSAVDIARLGVPASVLATALQTPARMDSLRRPVSRLKVEQIGGLSAAQLSSMTGVPPEAIINVIIRTGQAYAINPVNFTAGVVALLSPDVFKNNVFTRTQLMTVTKVMVNGVETNGPTFLNLLSQTQVMSLDLSKLTQADIDSLTADQKAALTATQLGQRTSEGTLVSTFLNTSVSLNAFWTSIETQIAAAITPTEKENFGRNVIQALTQNQLLFKIPGTDNFAISKLGAEYIPYLTAAQLRSTNVIRALFYSDMLKNLTAAQWNSDGWGDNGRSTLLAFMRDFVIDNISMLHGINWQTMRGATNGELRYFLFKEAISNYSSTHITQISIRTSLNETNSKYSGLLQKLANGTTVLQFMLDDIDSAFSTRKLTAAERDEYIQAIDLNFFRYAATVKDSGGNYVIDRTTLNRALIPGMVLQSKMRINGASVSGAQINNQARRVMIYQALMDTGRFNDIHFSTLYGTNDSEIANAMAAMAGHKNFDLVFRNFGNDFFNFLGEDRLEHALGTHVQLTGTNKSVLLGLNAIQWINWAALTNETVANMGRAIVPYLNKNTITDAILAKLSAYQLDSLPSETLSLAQFNSLTTEQKFGDATVANAGRIWWQKLTEGTPIISLMSKAVFQDLVANNPDYVKSMFTVNTFDRAQMRAFLETQLSDPAGPSQKLSELLSDAILNSDPQLRGSVLNANNIDQQTKDGTNYSDLLDFDSAKYLDLTGFSTAYVDSFMEREFAAPWEGGGRKTGRELLNLFNLDRKTSDGKAILSYFSNDQITALTSAQLSQCDIRIFWQLQRTTNGVTKYLYEYLDPQALKGLDIFAFSKFTSEELQSVLSDGNKLQTILDMHILDISQWEPEVVESLTAQQVSLLSGLQMTSRIKDGSLLIENISAQAIAGVEDWNNWDEAYRYFAKLFTATQVSMLSLTQLRSTVYVKAGIGNFRWADYQIIQLLDDNSISGLDDATLAELTVADLMQASNQGGLVINRLLPSAISKISLSVLTDPGVISALSTRQVSMLPTSLLETQIIDANTNTRTVLLERLTVAQMVGLTADQLGADLNTWTSTNNLGFSTQPKLIQLLSTAQVAGLSTTALGDLTSSLLLATDKNAVKILSMLSPVAVGRLNANVLGEASVRTELTSAQWGGLTLAQLSFQMIQPVDGFTTRPRLVQLLSQAQLAGLSDAVWGTINSTLLLARDQNRQTVLSKLSATAVGKLGTAALETTSVLGALTATQVGGLSLGQLSRVSNTNVMLIQRLTATQLGGLSGAVLSTLTAAMLLAQTSSNVTVLSQLSVTAVGSLSGAALEHATVLATLTAVQAGGLTYSQLSHQVSQSVAGFATRPKIIQLLSDAQLNGLSVTALGYLTSSELLALNSDGESILSNLGAVAIGNLSNAVLQNATIFQTLSAAQLGGLSTQWTTTLAALLTASQVAACMALDPEFIFKSFGNTVLYKSLSASAIAGIDLRDLTDAEIQQVFVSDLTDNQAAGLTYAQVSYVTGLANNPMLIELLTDSQLGRLSDSVLSSLTSTMLLKENSDGVAIIDRLPAASVAKLSASALQNASLLHELDGTHVQNLLSSQLETVFSANNGANSYVLENLDASQYAYLTQDQLDKLWNAEFRADETSTASQNDKNAADQLIQSIASRLNSNQLPTWYVDLHSNQNNNLAS